MKLKHLFEAEQLTPEESLKKFKHKDAAKYGETLIKTFGEPATVGAGVLMWDSADGMENIVLKDESVKHDFPKPHRDYVYSSQKITVPNDLYNVFGYVTGSIIIDGLKKTVTARCGGLKANAITLQFVKDVINGDVPQKRIEAKKEYANRIKKWENPSWYKNKTGD